MAQPQTTHDVHVERARQIADALDSQNVEQTLHEQFVVEFKAWEAEDPTRTLRDFDRAIGRPVDYTGKIVRGVTGPTRAPDWGSGSNKRTDVAAKVLRDRPQEVAPEIAKAMEDPEVREAVARHMTTQTANDISDAVRGLPHEPVERERRRKEADAFSKGVVQPLVDGLTSSNVILDLENALDELKEASAIDAATFDRISVLLDLIRVEAEVKRAMEGVR